MKWERIDYEGEFVREWVAFWINKDFYLLVVSVADYAERLQGYEHRLEILENHIAISDCLATRNKRGAHNTVETEKDNIKALLLRILEQRATESQSKLNAYKELLKGDTDQ